MSSAGQTALIVSALGCLFCSSVSAQVFTNLDFEQATIPTSPMLGDFVSAADALPDYTVEAGGVQQSSVWVNQAVLDYTQVVLIANSPSTPNNAIQGNYSVELTSTGPVTDAQATAFISQTGLIPADAQTITFLVQPYPYLSEENGTVASTPFVFLNGTEINVTPESTTDGITTYVGDISAFAGTTATLELAAMPVGGVVQEDLFTLDSVRFSATPEPATWSLALLGLALVYGARRRLRMSHA